MKALSFIIAFSLSANALASGPVEIQKGQPAPFTGILFTKEQEYKLRLINEEKDFLVKKTELLEKYSTLNEEQVKLWRSQSEDLSKRLIEAQNDSFWKKAMFFGLGVVATIGSAYAVKGVIK